MCVVLADGFASSYDMFTVLRISKNDGLLYNYNLSKDNFKEQASFDQSVGIVLAVTLLLRNLPYRGVYVQNNSLQQ